MTELTEVYDQIREDLAKKTDAFGSMTLDGVHITASNILVAHYLEELTRILYAKILDDAE